MAWTSGNFPFGSTLTYTDMNNVYANFAAIAAGSIGAPEIQSDALDSNCVDFASIIDGSITDSSLNCSGGSYQYVPKGVVNLIASAGSASLEYYVNGAWYPYDDITTTQAYQVTSDGSNVRVGGYSGTNTIVYRRFFQ